MTTTYAELLGHHHVEIPAHLEADAEIPVLTGMQRQGDIIVIPMRPGQIIGTSVPPEGVPVVRGEAGGNTHLLVADGHVLWAARQATGADPDLGTLEVVEGAAYLLHPEHGGQGIGLGQYRIRRQVEAAETARLVSD